MGQTAQQGTGGRWQMSTKGWDTERWLAVLVLAALAMLIAIKMGFRGVNAFGASVSVS